MKTNFFKQASTDDKENKKPGTNNAIEGDKDYTSLDEKTNQEKEQLYHKEGIIDPNQKKPEEMSPEEKEALAKKLEDEAIEKIIKKARTQMQMSCLRIQSDVMGIY